MEVGIGEKHLPPVGTDGEEMGSTRHMGPMVNGLGEILPSRYGAGTRPTLAVSLTLRRRRATSRLCTPSPVSAPFAEGEGGKSRPQSPASQRVGYAVRGIVTVTRYLNRIVIGVAEAVPGAFRISITPRSLLFLLLLTMFLPEFVSLSFTGLVAPGGMFATAEAIEIIGGAFARVSSRNRTGTYQQADAVRTGLREVAGDGYLAPDGLAVGASGGWLGFEGVFQTLEHTSGLRACRRSRPPRRRRS
jgi:hypothetical protein